MSKQKRIPIGELPIKGYLLNGKRITTEEALEHIKTLNKREKRQTASEDKIA